MDALTKDFPFLASCAYLDTAAVGLSAPGSGAAAAHFLDNVKSMGMCGADLWRAKADDLRAQLGKLLGATDSHCEFLANASEGMHLFARAWPWSSKDVIVLAEDEYPTVRHAWDHARAAGAEVRLVPIRNEHEREELLLAAIEPGVTLLAASQVHWHTGTALDLQRLGAECRRNGTVFLVDGTQAAGAVPTSLRDVDVYSASGFKWLAGPFGLGFLFVREGLRARLQPTVLGAWNEPEHGERTALRYGHPNYPGIYALSAALAWLESFGWEQVFARNRRLLEHLQAGLDRCGVELLAPRNRSAGIASFHLRDGTAFHEAALAAQVRISQKGAITRLSPHFYNGTAAIDRLLDLVDGWR